MRLAKSSQGYSLIELLVAMLLSGALITGVSMAYVTITDLVKTNKNLENAQEVIRFTSEVFTRSLKQTSSTPTLNSSSALLTVNHDANAIACNGTRPSSDFDERYTLENNQLKCDIGSGAQTILTGVENISFSQTQQVVSITVQPEAQQGETTGVGPASSIQIDVALSEIILMNALSSASGT